MFLIRILQYVLFLDIVDQCLRSYTQIFLQSRFKCYLTSQWEYIRYHVTIKDLLLARLAERRLRLFVLAYRLSAIVVLKFRVFFVRLTSHETTTYCQI